MLFVLGSIFGAGLAALNTFKNKRVSWIAMLFRHSLPLILAATVFYPDASNAPSLHINVNLNLGNMENVTVVSPQVNQTVGPQFDFKFIDTSYDLASSSPDASAISLLLQNKTYSADIYPSKIDFIADSDPPTAEAQLNVPLLPGLAEGSYNLTIMEWQWGGPLNSPKSLSRFEVPVIFVFDPKAHEAPPTKDEL
ncbi:hypothetical protein BD311DRAFT_754720 [Dichomitus squalens]|uniref:Uncharacterized protein n=1 Tax=Dichomitus squalens TaxID=114155 RepID=A0A4Q9MV87_9APHY|nr:hypothetical protein BD311DRAFT_754720 [Dichomitus squalens]